MSYFNTANLLQKKGRLEEAIALYQQAIKEDPNFYWSHYNLGEALAKQGQWEEALIAYNCAIELNSNSPWFYYSLGKVLAQLSRWEEAILSYQKALELNPNDQEIQLALIDAKQQLNQVHLAELIAIFQRDIEQNPNDKKAYQKLLQIQPNNWEIWLKLGQNLGKLNQHNEAIEAYKRVLELNFICVEAYRSWLELQPENCEIWWGLANSLAQQERRGEALEAYRKGLEINPEFFIEFALKNKYNITENNWEIWSELINTLIQRGQVPEAINIYEIIISLAFKDVKVNAEIHWEIAKCLWKLEKYDEARQAADRAIAIKPDWLDIHLSMGIAFWQLGKLDECMEFCEKTLALNPNVPDAYYHLGLAQVRKGQLDRGIQSYKRAIELKDDLIEVYSALVEALRCQGDLEQATNYCYKMLDLNMNSWNAYCQLGDIHINEGKLAEALKYYCKSNKIKYTLSVNKKIIPGILVNTLPKSGSMYILDSLSKGLNLSIIAISNSSAWPDDVIYNNEEILSRMASGGVICNHHLPANSINLAFISMWLDKLIVHVRDPRQATLSLVHHLNRLKNEAPMALILTSHLFEEGYFSMSLTDQISWQIEKGYFRETINFIENWLNISESPSFHPQILFTKQEDLALKPKQFFQEILDFYEIENSTFIVPALPQFNANSHQRKGSVDEWKTIFTDEQLEKTSSLISKKLIERFNWS
ncbi:MAG: tetratricopeptide repeat protein [Microcoleus sp.]